MTMPTDDPIELAARVLAATPATPGPYRSEMMPCQTEEHTYSHQVSCDKVPSGLFALLKRGDADFFALAANAAPTLAAEVKRLTAELADWKESARIAAGETCGTEKHCTCVPLLRMELAAMEKQIAITELAADLNTIFTTCEKCWASVQKDSGAVCKCVVESLGAENARLSADLAALRRTAANNAAAGERDAGRAD